MTEPSLSLAADFAAATVDDWRRLALGVLRKSGASTADTPIEAVDDLLSATTYDGIRVAPLYPATTPVPPAGAPGSAPFTRGADPVRARWDVRQRHADPDPAVTREAILADLENGATSIWLDGIAPDDLPTVLDGVYLDLAGVVLGGADTRALARALLALARQRAVDPAALTGNLGLDPLGTRARTGETDTGPDLGPDTGLDTELVVRVAADHPGLRSVVADATVYHDAGASDAQELGCAAATGVAYLRALTGAGLEPAAAFGQLEFRYAATADQFLTIAKLRAARRMWARVAEVCGVPAAGGQRQHAVTSSAMMTARDPWVNMLRTTLACFAAGVGGADAVTVQPFDARLGLPDGFARRIARNTQSLLLDEANVGQVLDPAGGSWYVEKLTDDLAHRAWEWFTEIERAGGMAAALAGGLVADRIAATWDGRAANLAHRRDPVTGVSEYPNPDERLPQRRPAPQPPGGGLPRHHYGEAFEQLRARSDAAPQQPAVFLATLGPVAVHTARTGFAANLFAAGGVATVQSGPSTDPDAIAAAFATSGATIACICSSDKLYREFAVPVAQALRTAGARRVWLAGRHEADGVDDHLYAGCDAVAVLSTTLRDLGVA